MKIKPLGFYVVVEQVEVEDVSDGGIVLPSDLIKKEQQATAVGYVRAIGPTAYVGYPGCDLDSDTTPWPTTSKTPHGCWGLELGQKVEYRKFEGKPSSVKGYENYRYIPDSHIIGAIDDE